MVAVYVTFHSGDLRIFDATRPTRFCSPCRFHSSTATAAPPSTRFRRFFHHGFLLGCVDSIRSGGWNSSFCDTYQRGHSCFKFGNTDGFITSYEYECNTLLVNTTETLSKETNLLEKMAGFLYSKYVEEFLEHSG